MYLCSPGTVSFWALECPGYTACQLPDTASVTILFVLQACRCPGIGFWAKLPLCACSGVVFWVKLDLCAIELHGWSAMDNTAASDVMSHYCAAVTMPVLRGRIEAHLKALGSCRSSSTSFWTQLQLCAPETGLWSKMEQHRGAHRLVVLLWLHYSAGSEWLY